MSETHPDPGAPNATLATRGQLDQIDELSRWMLEWDSGPGTPPPSVEDARHHLHQLDELLAYGGQGAVYRTLIPEVAVKLAKHRQPDLTDVIREVSRLPISDLPVAMPFSTIEHPPGYVMTMVRGMTPIASLRRPARASGGSLLRWYAESGGVRRRLAALANLAEILAELHARGVVYGDLNPRNVLVSGSGGDAVYLIDTDNMRYAHETGSTPYAAGYAAPEHFDYPYSATFESDAYSLAVVAFEVLTGLRPFRDGSLVRQDRPGGPVELEADLGDLPSVIDDDASNHSHHWLAESHRLMTVEMLSMFKTMFGGGRHEPMMRATPSEVARELRKAHDLSVDCERCGLWHLGAGACPSCHTLNRPVELGVSLGDDSEPLIRISLNRARRTVGVRRVALPPHARIALGDRSEPIVECALRHRRVEIRPFEGVDTQRRLEIGDATKIKVDGPEQITLTLRAS